MVTVKLTTAPTVAREVLGRLGVRGVGERPGSGSGLPLPGGRFESLRALRAEAMGGTGPPVGRGRGGALVAHLRRPLARCGRPPPRHTGLERSGRSGGARDPGPARARVLAEQARTVDALLLRRTELGPRGLVTGKARRAPAEHLSSSQPWRTGRSGCVADLGQDPPRRRFHSCIRTWS